MTSVTFPPSLGGDGSTVSDDSNPVTGLANGGHRERFVPAMSQMLACMNGALTQAQGKVDDAADQVALAEDEADAAAVSAAAAAASAASALQSPGTSATSTTSLTIGTGSKSFTLAQTGKAFVVNQYVQVVTGSGWMLGPITAFNSGTGAMTINATHAGGSGTFSAWSVTPGSPLNLPSPAGQAGKALVSNGTDYVFKSQSPTTLITAAGALTDEGNYTIARDVNVTLPDLTLARNIALTLPSNLPSFNSNVNTSDGWTIGMGFSAGVTKTNAPMAFDTPHGWWGAAPMTPPLLSTTTLGAGAQSLQASVALSATLHAHFYSDGTNVQVVGVDPTTGATGAAVSFAGNTTAFAFQVNSTTAIVFNGNNARTVSFSGLTATINTAITFGDASYEAPVQLTSTTYLVRVNLATSDLFVVSVSGTTCIQGTAVSSGVPASTANFRMAPISATAVLLAYSTSASGSSTISFRVASISGATITLNAVTQTSGSINRPANVGNFGSLFTINQGSSYVFAATDITTSSTGNWFGVTVSGTTVSVGAAQVQANFTADSYQRRTFIYRATSSGWTLPSNDFASLNSTTGLFKVSGGLAAISISGTTLTFGAKYTTDTPTTILTDVATGANLYSIGATSYSKLSISGLTITATYTVAVVPTAIFNDTLTDKAVNYSATWYSWTLGVNGTVRVPISATKFAAFSGAAMRIYGDFS